MCGIIRGDLKGEIAGRIWQRRNQMSLPNARHSVDFRIECLGQRKIVYWQAVYATPGRGPEPRAGRVSERGGFREVGGDLRRDNGVNHVRCVGLSTSLDPRAVAPLVHPLPSAPDHNPFQPHPEASAFTPPLPPLPPYHPPRLTRPTR